MEHLRELRNRLVKSVLAIVVLSVVAAFFYDEIYAALTQPYTTSVADLAREKGVDAQLVIDNVAGPLTLFLKTSLVVGIVLSSPVWLYQIWAFIVPAMHRHERKWTMAFVAVAGPLFILGVGVGYYVLPKGIEILIGFTPDGVSNFTNIGLYLNFILRMLLVFGVAFEIPLFVLMLNFAGVVSGKKLGEVRPWIIVGTFVFAAVATPSTDPISMLFLALPMTVLFMISEIIARVVDRRRAARSLDDADYASWSDDEASPIVASGAVGATAIEGPSDLDAPDDDVIRRDRGEDDDIR
ncbi:twin-arginine translocase subunit TatC [Solicola sp. PLA-1-18]|uniref:twin-arginine translocase subunit TatC n=1 Tax=Solicola sp. PLA-1-18 TaxID=3380532 RepID=UPI003B7B1D48